MFTIPNREDAPYPNPQAIWMQADIEALRRGLEGTNVLDGCAVTEDSPAGMTVTVAAGNVRVEGTEAAVAGGDVVIGAAHATQTRIDLIVADDAGALSAVAGTGVVVSLTSGPKAPDLPATRCLLAMVTVPPTVTAIVDDMIVDKRVQNKDASTASAGLMPALANDAEKVFLSDGTQDHAHTVRATNANSRVVLPVGVDLWAT